MPKTAAELGALGESAEVTTRLSRLGVGIRAGLGMSSTVGRVTSATLRGIGRFSSYAGPTLVIAEGFYDWGVIGKCTILCNADPCEDY